ncbi:MAG TPA: class II fructose-bisphosphate aldolase [bacterium]|nr:class II fructose-bisphosphate aldolase [bacterium]
MLVTMKEMAGLVKKGKNAVAAFHALNLEQIQGILEAALEERSPVVIALDEPAAMYAGLGAFEAMVRELAEDVPVPVATILDHVHDPVLVSKAFVNYYSGVTVDPREKSPESVGPWLASIQDLCAKHSAFFEVVISIRDISLEQALESARKISELARPDSLCISLGGEHKKGPEPAFFDFLRLVGAQTGTSVALSGAGAWPDADLQSAVAAGAWKLSVGTRINLAFTRGLRSFMDANPDRIHPRSYLASARDALSAEVRHCIQVMNLNAI